MRRILTLTLALVLTLSLAACGGKNDAPPLYDAGDVTAIDESGAFTAELYDLEDLDADMAFALYRLGDYGLSQEDLKTCTVRRSAGASCEEAAVLVFTSADKAKTAVEALGAYIDSQIESNTDYRPGEVPKLKEALISQRGESVLLVVANDLDAAKKAVE